MARVGSTKIAKAFINKKAAKTKNTETDGTQVKLFGNVIAWHENGSIGFTLSGWNTTTTRDRLKHLFIEAGIPISVCLHKREPYVYNYRTQQMHGISSQLSYNARDFI
jgi:hypothetical protein